MSGCRRGGSAARKPISAESLKHASEVLHNTCLWLKLDALRPTCRDLGSCSMPRSSTSVRSMIPPACAPHYMLDPPALGMPHPWAPAKVRSCAAGPPNLVGPVKPRDDAFSHLHSFTVPPQLPSGPHGDEQRPQTAEDLGAWSAHGHMGLHREYPALRFLPSYTL